MYADLNQSFCTNCKQHKNVSEFGKNKNRVDGLMAWCKPCKKEADAKNYKKNPSKVKTASKVWKANNPEKVARSNAGYKKRNKAKVNADTQKYKKKNPGVTNANTAKRRAALLQRTPKWLTDIHLEHIRLFYESATALTKELSIPFEVDHVVPLQGEYISGLHVPWNLQILTADENLAKKNKYKV